jgi:hypothetical protein
MTDKANVAAHYGAILEEIERPTTRQITIEVYALDPGTDLAECTFEHIGLTTGGKKRFVNKMVGRRMQTVGMWRIVPNV